MTRAAPFIEGVTVTRNPNNTLAAVVSFRTRNVDSARVVYRPASPLSMAEGAPPLATPYVSIHGDHADILVLGLRPDATFEFVVEGIGRGVGRSPQASFSTAPLPAPLAALQLAITGAPTPGFTLTEFSPPGNAFIVAFDGSGTLCWYRQFDAGENEVGLDAEQQRNGNFTIYVGASTGWQPSAGRFIEVTPAGDVVRTYAAAGTSFTDPHELRLEFSGDSLRHAHLFDYDLRRVDLTSLGGRPDQLVAGHRIVRQSAGGTVEFSWSAWSEFTLDDWVFVPKGLASLPTIDFDHPNSLDMDFDGNYVASFASLGVIAKIEASAGRTIWRLGGRRSDFTLAADPLGGFGIQHSARVLANGHLLLFDNGTGHNPHESRAVEYRLNLQSRTATMVWQYRHDPALFAPFAGSAQRLSNGNTFVAFGSQPVVAEVSADGRVIWEGQVTSGGRALPFIYRATRLRSLYQFASM